MFETLLKNIAPKSKSLLSEPQSFEDIESDIIRDTLEFEKEAFFERDDELVTPGKVNPTREMALYYPKVRAYQEEQDRLFAAMLPDEYARIVAQVGSLNDRWKKTANRAIEVQNLLNIGSKQKGGILDFRPKSVFGIWQKMYRNGIEATDVYDASAMRIMTGSTDDARKMAQKILERFELGNPITPNPHEAGTSPESSFHDTFDTPNERGYAHIRMRLIDGNEPFEIIIQTYENYCVWRKRDIQIYLGGIASPKYGIVYTMDEIGE